MTRELLMLVVDNALEFVEVEIRERTLKTTLRIPVSTKRRIEALIKNKKEKISFNKWIVDTVNKALHNERS